MRLFLLFLLCASLAAALPPVSRLGQIRNAHILDKPGGRIRPDSRHSIAFDLVPTQDKSSVKLPASSLRLQLEPNRDLLGQSTSIWSLKPDGSVLQEDPFDYRNIRVFRGRVWTHEAGLEKVNDVPVGNARITVHRDGSDLLFEGTFDIHGFGHQVTIDNDRMFYYLDDDIESEFPGSPQNKLVNSIHSDLLRRDLLEPQSNFPSHGCEFDHLPFNTDPAHPVWKSARQNSKPLARYIPRQDTPGESASGGSLVSTIGVTDGCPSARKIALVGVVTDCTYTSSFNSSESARSNVISQFNAASAVFERTFNIALGIHTLIVSERECPGTAPNSAKWNMPCTNSATLQDRLSLFSEWRGQRGDDGQSHWTLLTTCRSGTSVGVAWLGQACFSDSFQANSTDGSLRFVSGTNVVSKASPEWQVIAHETGHTYGAVHDCSEDTCKTKDAVTKQECCPLNAGTCDANAKYIMNPTTVNGITDFSPCSIGNICSSIGHNAVKTSCLTNNRDVTIITGPQCGNGIVEKGEECDCGGEAGCGENACCDAKTCKFKGSAVCDDSNEDCCEKCQMAAAGTVCRAGNGLCDPNEVCTGDSSSCPPDKVLDDGSKCGDDKANLACASGQCTSRDDQCRNILGGNMKACDSDSCQVSCTSDKMSSVLYTTCITSPQNFLDGTPCAGGGKCQNGSCRGSSSGKEILNWLEKNKLYLIIAGSILGAIILISIVSCLWRRHRLNKRRKDHVLIPSGPPPYYPPASSGATLQRPGRGHAPAYPYSGPDSEQTLAPMDNSYKPNMSNFSHPRQEGQY